MLISPESICRVRVDGSGRIVIPADMRERYGIGIGDELIVTAGESALAVQTVHQSFNSAIQTSQGSQL